MRGECVWYVSVVCAWCVREWCVRCECVNRTHARACVRVRVEANDRHKTDPQRQKRDLQSLLLRCCMALVEQNQKYIIDKRKETHNTPSDALM